MVTTYHDKLLGRKTIIITSCFLVLFRLPIINKKKFLFSCKKKEKKKREEKIADSQIRGKKKYNYITSRVIRTIKKFV